MSHFQLTKQRLSECASDIIEDLSSRPSFWHWWEHLDGDIKNDVYASIQRIIANNISESHLDPREAAAE